MTASVAASVRQRLKNYARESQENFNLVLVRFGLERLLYRLSTSPHADQFILKGGALFYCWTEDLHRPTRDLDFLGSGDPDPDRFYAIFRELISADVSADGLTFDVESLNVDTIRDDHKYNGVRVTLLAYLGTARINLQADIGFGDAVTPHPTRVEFPVLLDFPKPGILAYSRETVIAEKFQAMVDLGIANSRMKDFFDIWTFARGFEFDGRQLQQALQATFQRRDTTIPKVAPLALTTQFSGDAGKQKQWQAFAGRLGVRTEFADVVSAIADFLMPCVARAAVDVDFSKVWKAGAWTETDAEHDPI